MSTGKELFGSEKQKEHEKFEKALEKLKALEQQEELNKASPEQNELEAGMSTLTIPGQSLF